MKTVLIVGGAGVGVFVLLRLLSPSQLSASSRAQQQQGSIGTLQGLASLGASFKGLFGGSSGSTSSALVNPGSFEGGAYADPASQSALRNFDTGNYSVSNGFSFTDADGTFIAG